MKIESFIKIFQQKNTRLSTKKVIHNVNKVYKIKFKANVIKAYRLSTVFVGKVIKIVDKYKSMLINMYFEEKVLI